MSEHSPGEPPLGWARKGTAKNKSLGMWYSCSSKGSNSSSSHPPWNDMSGLLLIHCRPKICISHHPPELVEDASSFCPVLSLQAGSEWGKYECNRSLLGCHGSTCSLSKVFSSSSPNIVQFPLPRVLKAAWPEAVAHKFHIDKLHTYTHANIPMAYRVPGILDKTREINAFYIDFVEWIKRAPIESFLIINAPRLCLNWLAQWIGLDSWPAGWWWSHSK